MNSQFLAPVDKLATDIPGFDLVTLGGLPRGRTTLVAGTAGSAKTVFAAQFLAEGILHSKEAGVFVTFEEGPDDLRRNMASFGWPIVDWERQGLWRFVDGSIQAHDDEHIVGQYDLGGLLVRIEHAVNAIGARRVSLDSLGAIFNRLHDSDTVRHELLRVSVALKQMSVTSVLTAERTSEYGAISRHGVEEFVADNVVILRNALEDEKRRRTIEVLKYRGTSHQKGEFPFSVTPERGVTVIPLSAIELKQRSSNLRVTSGNADLDGLCDGGFFRDSVVLVSGATGTGKTLLTTEFLAGGVNNNERCLLLAFEESREQLFRNAIGWGVNFEQMEAESKLKVYCVYPETASLEDHLITIKDLVAEFRPNRVAVDSLSALERVGTIRSFREFVIGMTSFIKHQEITGLFTATTPTLTGGASVTESHISTLTDSIILLRYVEINGEMRRGITVLKMRGSMHNKDICEFTIDGGGLHVGKPFRNVVGILSGNPHMIATSEIERLDELFRNP